MTKFLKYLIVGIIFGITLTKAEIISWYRIYEMFSFQSFHMYGVIGSAVLLGVLAVQLIKRKGIKAIGGQEVNLSPKDMSIPRYLIGGTIFGLGWALTGACPGPLFIMIGNGFGVMLIVIAAAMLGTYVYGLMRHRLPH